MPRSSKKFIRTAVLAGIAALVIAGSLFFFFRKEENQDSGALQTVAIRRGNIEELVTAQGKLESRDYVDVGVQVSGQLKIIHVEIGDEVKQGDLIAEIDPRIYEAKVDADLARIKSLEAQIAQQKAQIDLARTQLARNQALMAANAISREVLDTSEAALKTATASGAALRAQLEEQQSTLKGDQTNLSYTKIYAPMDGTIVTQSAREGQTLNANQQAPIIVQLANLDIMTVRAQVAEADIMRLTPDMEVYFNTLGSSTRQWHATVRQILPSPEIINDVVLYNVLVDVENKDHQLMTGMSTQMFFVLGRADNVLLAPVAALGKQVPEQDNENGKAYQLRVMNNGKPVETVVHIGLMNRTDAELRDGLNENDQVIISAGAPRAPETPGGGRQPRAPGLSSGPRL